MKPWLAIAFAASALPAFSAEVNFNKHIAPILNEYCAPCHRPGESGPFSLLTYSDAKKHARQIVTVTKSRYMPPWLPEPGYGEFAGERRLTTQQLATIQQWVDGGLLEGSPGDLPPAPKFTEGWQLGEPDLIVSLPKPFILRAGGEDVYRNLIFSIPVDRRRYVKALEVRAGNKKTVHHANILVDRAGISRAQDGRDGQIGFPGMDIHIESEQFEPDGHFLFWKPGTVPFVEPHGMAWPVDPGTDLILNMHLQPSGKPEPLEPTLGLYFTDEPVTLRPMLIQLESDDALDIPPGVADFKVKDDFTLPVDVQVLGIYPHAHYLGKELQGIATLPDGSKKWLMLIKHWDANWQAVFRYKEPLRLPRGTVLSILYHYDNTEANPANPNHPPKRVKAGNRAVDEMSHLWVQVLPADRGAEASETARLALQEALMRNKLRKTPTDFAANYNLGVVLTSRERYADAEPLLRKAVNLEPKNATARNSLGVALEALGSVDAAMAQFQEAMRLRPNYTSAEFNLGNSLLSSGRFDEAARSFRSVLQATPNDAASRQKLGLALNGRGNELARKGDMRAALTCFEEATEIQPDDAGAFTNLGTAFAIQGDLERAKLSFERALQIQPGLEIARKNLEHVERDLKNRPK